MDHKDNNFSHILFNIIIPVIILNKGHKLGLDPKLAVLLALSFPLFFTLRSLIKSKKINYVSLLGLLNVMVSGTLTLLALGGIWFAIKEAAFPLLIGGFVLGSIWTKKPFFQTLFMNPSTFDVDKVEARLETEEKKAQFSKLMKNATLFLSISFVMSATLNFILALRIFIPFTEGLTQDQKQALLNEQLSQMTMYSMGVILIPSMLFLGTILFFTFKKIHAITGLTSDDLLLK